MDNELEYNSNDTTFFDLNCSINANFSISNYSCGNIQQEEYAYLLPWWRQVIWTIIFVAMACTATFGNLIVIWIVMSHKRMRTVTNYFIVNLSIADTMVSSLNVTFNFVYMLNGHWPFGNIYCKVCSFISIISVCGSVFTMVAISVDRYNAIIRPLKPRMGRPMTILMAVLIWVVAMVIAVPQLLYFYTTGTLKTGTVMCVSMWPDGPSDFWTMEFIYNVCFMILTYFLPLAIMIVIYVSIGFELWGQRVIGEATTHQQDSINSKRRVVKMMIVVVSVFGTCWLPYHIYFIYSNIDPRINHWAYIQETYLAIYWLAMSNSMINPMIYFAMNNRFRQGFLQVFYFFTCRSNDQTNTANSCALGTMYQTQNHLSVGGQSQDRRFSNYSSYGFNRQPSTMSTKLTPNNIRVKINGNSCVKTTLAAPSTTTSTASSCAKKGAGISNYGNRLSVNAEVVCDLPTAPIITSNGGENNITTNNHYATTASNGGEKNVCL